MNANLQLGVAEEEIQKEAYLLYVASGCVSGRDLQNWLAARARVAMRHGSAGEKARNIAITELHFPLNANVSRGPFGSLHPFENRN